MTTINWHNFLLVAFMALIITLTACTKQNWYQGARSAQTTQCMKEPLSEYEDCNKQSDESYEDYKNSRDKLDKKSESD